MDARLKDATAGKEQERARPAACDLLFRTCRLGVRKTPAGEPLTEAALQILERPCDQLESTTLAWFASDVLCRHGQARPTTDTLKRLARAAVAAYTVGSAEGAPRAALMHTLNELVDKHPAADWKEWIFS